MAAESRSGCTGEEQVDLARERVGGGDASAMVALSSDGVDSDIDSMSSNDSFHSTLESLVHSEVKLL